MIRLAILTCLSLCLAFSGPEPAGDEEKEYPIVEFNNIPYYPEGHALASGLTQLNLIIPQGVENPRVLIWIGGGAWAYVDRRQEMDLCRKIARQGIVVISVGHRLSPALLGEPKNPEGIKHPEHVKDVAQAFQWVYAHAKEYGYPAGDIFVGGYSSGAHLAALLASDGRYLQNLGLSTKNIKAIIPVAGGYDIPHYRLDLIEEDPAYEENHINAVFGSTHEAHVDASPVTYIDGFDTPMLLISEGETYEYSIVFESKLREKGKKNFLAFNAHKETHASLWLNLSNEEHSIYRNFIVDYIKSL